MAYIKTEEVKQIREELKKQYPDIKWSVSKEDSTNVNVCMLEGNINFSDISNNYFRINQYHLYKFPKHHQKLFNNIIDNGIFTIPVPTNTIFFFSTLIL